jgi:hypothetical protein
MLLARVAMFSHGVKMDDLQFIDPYAIVSQLQVATICFPRVKVDIRSMV